MDMANTLRAWFSCSPAVGREAGGRNGEVRGDGRGEGRDRGREGGVGRMKGELAWDLGYDRKKARRFLAKAKIAIIKINENLTLNHKYSHSCRSYDEAGWNKVFRQAL